MTHVPAIDWQPGLVAIDTVAHCGHSTKGQYAFTLTVTDVFTGWTINQAIKNKAAVWVAEAMEDVHAQFPYPIDHVHSDNGSEFLNDPVTKWADDHEIKMTRSRPSHSNDNPFAEQKNDAIVRRSALNYRYDTDTELARLNELWPLVNLRENLFLPTKKVTGYRKYPVRDDRAQLRPATHPRGSGPGLRDTPAARTRAAHRALRQVDLAQLTDHITRIQHRQISLAEAKTYAQAPHAA